MMEALNCKNCGAPVDADAIVEHLAMARCGHCDSVFSLAPYGAIAPSQPLVRPWVAMPRGIRMIQHEDILEIHRRWFTPMIVFLALFACIWNSFMIVWHGIALAQGAWFMSLFGLIHTAVGVGLAYLVLAGIFNTTSIRAGRGTLTVKHGPLPWPGNTVLATHDIKQFVCREKTSHGKNGTSHQYSMIAVRENFRKVKLLTSLTAAEQALYVEQELERFLEIEDRPYRGEIPR